MSENSLLERGQMPSPQKWHQMWLSWWMDWWILLAPNQKSKAWEFCYKFSHHKTRHEFYDAHQKFLWFNIFYAREFWKASSVTNIFNDFRLTILICWLTVFWQWLYQEIKIKPWFVHNLSLFGSVYNPESIWSFFIFDTIVSIRSENSARGFITIPRETNDFSFDSGQKISYCHLKQSTKTIYWPDAWTRFEFSVFGFIFERFLALWIDFLNCVICLSIVLSSLPASFSALESGPFDWLLINLANRTSSSLCFSCISSNLSPEKF